MCFSDGPQCVSAKTVSTFAQNSTCSLEKPLTLAWLASLSIMMELVHLYIPIHNTDNDARGKSGRQHHVRLWTGVAKTTPSAKRLRGPRIERHTVPLTPIG